MSEQKNKEVSRVNLNVPTDLYAQYKIALLQRWPRRNVTQDLIAHMREIIEETERLNT